MKVIFLNIIMLLFLNLNLKAQSSVTNQNSDTRNVNRFIQVEKKIGTVTSVDIKEEYSKINLIESKQSESKDIGNSVEEIDLIDLKKRAELYKMKKESEDVK